MAIAVTSDLVDISNCDTVSTLGAFTRLNGVNSGNPYAEPDAKLQGAACIAWKEGTTSGATDTGGHFNSTAVFDLSGKHLFHWRMNVTPGNMATKANRGTVLGLTNTSTTSTTAWSTTNYKTWYLDGSDTDSVGGWKPYVLDPAGTPDASAGTLTLSSVKNVAFINRQLSGVNNTLNNAMVDAVRMGTGLTYTGTNSGTPGGLSDIYSVDASSTNAWGVLTKTAGVYFGAGKMTFGTSGQTAITSFKDVAQTLVWRDMPVAATFYELGSVGASSFLTTVQFGEYASGQTSDGWTLKGASSTVRWSINVGANSKHLYYGCSLSEIRTASLSATSELRDCQVKNSGQITTNGALLDSCAFSSLRSADGISCLKISSPSQLAAVTNCIFNSNGGVAGNYGAIEITAAGTYTLSGSKFASNRFDIINSSAGLVEVNCTNGANASTYVNTGGGTTSIINAKAKTFTGLPSGTEVRIRQGSYTLAHDDNVTTGSYTYSYSPSSKPARAQFTLPGYVFEDIDLMLDSTDQSLPVAYSPDPSYI